MIKTSIELLAESIGFDIGNSDDQTQANLINGLARGMANSMDSSHYNMQLAYIIDKLDSKSLRLIKELYGFVQLREAE